MKITKNDAVEMVKSLQWNFSDVNKIKLLDQDERKFILTAIKVAETESVHSKVDQIEELVKNEESDSEAIALKNGIKQKAVSSEKPKHSNFLVSFFKGFANIFLGRVSSERVFTAIKDTPASAKYF